MNDELLKNSNKAYKEIEKKAEEYYKFLDSILKEKKYMSFLLEDIKKWEKKHIKNKIRSVNLIQKQLNTKDYKAYINWLEGKGKLDNYLDRSISYILMRDLGKSLDSLETQSKVNDTINSLKKYLIDSEDDLKNKDDEVSLSWLYKKAKEENIEGRLIWLINKLKKVYSNIPEGIDSSQAMRKIIKIIIGVFIYKADELKEDISKKERRKKLDEAIILGYSYGLTYPFIDDLFDAKILCSKDERQYSDLIRKTLIAGEVPELNEDDWSNIKLIKYIYSELKEGFKYIKDYQSNETMESFLNLSYVFFNSQEIDRNKELSNSKYSNEEIYIPIILKSASSRLIIPAMVNGVRDKNFEGRVFFYGIYNQLADDFTDLFDDTKNRVVTPYSYYMKYHNERTDIINPFELYWTVIFYLIHEVYNSEPKTSEVILDRAINGLRRAKEKLGNKKYKEVMSIFNFENEELNKLIEYAVINAEDIDFLDKLLRDYVIDILDKEKREQKEFSAVVNSLKERLNKILIIDKRNYTKNITENIIGATNYAIEGSGKRLRPIIAWVVGVSFYGLCEKSIEPLLKSLEYMHTASLILDDLPSQDNSNMRRGRKTVHEVYDVATAELASIFLTQKAIEEQSLLNKFSYKSVLKLIRYSTEVVKAMSMGQSMDLVSRGKILTIDELKTLCFYKTGLAFEASLVMPAMLGNAKDKEIGILKNFAKYAGITFQIKDDLLDVDGDSEILGKLTGKDVENKNTTFVTLLGYEGAEKELFNYYCLAIDEIEKLDRESTFLKQLMNYIINRNN